MRYSGSRKKPAPLGLLLALCATFTGIGLLILTLRSVDPSPPVDLPTRFGLRNYSSDPLDISFLAADGPTKSQKTCATVEEMGKVFGGSVLEESLRVRKLIQRHFDVNGASTVRALPPEQFCRQGFILGKSSEAGFGNEMYKMLTGAVLSVMLNRSLIIGQTRHIGSFSILSFYVK